jgi:hypothetical protein
MRVYHGSYTDIGEIDLSKCKPRKDFGQAFYVTKFREQAELWAQRMGAEHDTDGVVTEFKFDEFAYDEDDMQMLRFDEYNEEWLDFVVKNRSSRKGITHTYDIVEGPVANDDISQRINRYLRGEISKEKFLSDLKFHKETHQIAFCTMKSLQMLEKVDNAFQLGNMEENIIEALMSDYKLSEEEATDLYYLSKTNEHITRKSINAENETWQKVYELLKQELKLPHNQ